MSRFVAAVRSVKRVPGKGHADLLWLATIALVTAARLMVTGYLPTSYQLLALLGVVLVLGDVDWTTPAAPDQERVP